ncbi:type VI secretion IcmF C-terminal domain-containing protein, partial [Cronobacter sakazakii]|uniref:type VI secretion IcmF C-terminal domain-containing protein n=1 Tax=Cronobacter sakazakii TaxID=28141 RepID=UPI002A80F157
MPVVYIVPSITRLQMQFDDAIAYYSHGPVRPLFFHWPGGHSAIEIRISARPAQRESRFDMVVECSWSPLHWVDLTIIHIRSCRRTGACSLQTTPRPLSKHNNDV